MSRLPFHFAAALLVAVCAGAAPTLLHVRLADSTVDVRFVTVKHKSAPYLAVDDVAKYLPITLKRDADTDLLTLCSRADCVPVFVGDEEDATVRSSLIYVSGALTARALGCKIDFDKKAATASFDCKDGLPPAKPGSSVGDYAPGFVLASDSGVVSLRNLLKKGAVIVVFVRSGEWEPFSQILLKDVQTRLDSLKARGFEVVAIHGYQPRVGAKWAKTLGLTFPQLADTFSCVMRGYDVHDAAHLPHPALFAIDRSGVIQYRRVFEDISQPPDLEPVWKELLESSAPKR
jgi:peroxiredoxin